MWFKFVVSMPSINRSYQFLSSISHPDVEAAIRTYFPMISPETRVSVFDEDGSLAAYYDGSWHYYKKD